MNFLSRWYLDPLSIELFDNLMSLVLQTARSSLGEDALEIEPHEIQGVICDHDSIEDYIDKAYCNEKVTNCPPGQSAHRIAEAE